MKFKVGDRVFSDWSNFTIQGESKELGTIIKMKREENIILIMFDRDRAGWTLSEISGISTRPKGLKQREARLWWTHIRAIKAAFKDVLDTPISRAFYPKAEILDNGKLRIQL